MNGTFPSLSIVFPCVSSNRRTRGARMPLSASAILPRSRRCSCEDRFFDMELWVLELIRSRDVRSTCLGVG